MIRILRRIAVAGLTGIVLAFLFFTAWFVYEVFWQPDYDDRRAGYRTLAASFREFQERIDAEPESAEAFSIDLSTLNGGNWTIACLFGGNQNPLGDIEQLGATISAEDRDRIEAGQARWPGLRLHQVEAFEMMVAYIDQGRAAHFAHFEQGIGPYGQHLKKCVSKPETILTLSPAELMNGQQGTDG